MLTIVFINYPLVQPDIESTALAHALYTSLSRVAWSLAICYIIYACEHGYGGPVDLLLSITYWHPISRLNYSIYLLHFPVTVLTMGTIKSTEYFSEANAVR